MTPQQSRAARAVLGLTVAETSAASTCALATVVAFEKGRDVRLSSVTRLQEFYEGRGVQFTENGHGLVWPKASAAAV